MPKVPRIPEIKSLRQKCKGTQISQDARILLVSSSIPDAVFASAVLSRAIIRSGHLLHVTFVEPVIDAATVKSILSQYSDYQPVFVGVTISKGESDLSPDAVFIASLTEIPNAINLCPSKPIIPTTVAFLTESLELTISDLRIAAIGILVSSATPIEDQYSSAIVEAAKKSCDLLERPEYLLYGANFMPARECLSVSIYPYLDGISGDSSECDSILEHAEIALPRRSHPLTTLQKDERQRITSSLLERIDPALISRIIGANFENLVERKDSPMRWISNVRILSAIAWANRELGTGLSVWMGDRARSLRSLLDLGMDTINRVIVSLHELLPNVNEGEFQTTGPVTHLSYPEADGGVLTEVSRILLERNSIPTRFLILQGNDILVLSWARSDVDLVTMMSSLQASGLDPHSTSHSSVVLSPTSDWQTIIASLEKLEVSSH